MGGQGGGKGSDEAQMCAGKLEDLRTGSNQGEDQTGAIPICGVPAEEGPGMAVDRAL